MKKIRYMFFNIKDYYYNLKNFFRNFSFLRELSDSHWKWDQVDSIRLFAENCIITMHEEDCKSGRVDWHSLDYNSDGNPNKWDLDRSQFRYELLGWYMYCTYWRNFYEKYSNSLPYADFEFIPINEGKYFRMSDDHWTKLDRQRADVRSYISKKIEQKDQEMIEFVAKNRRYFWT